MKREIKFRKFWQHMDIPPIELETEICGTFEVWIDEDGFEDWELTSLYVNGIKAPTFSDHNKESGRMLEVLIDQARRDDCVFDQNRIKLPGEV